MKELALYIIKGVSVSGKGMLVGWRVVMLIIALIAAIFSYYDWKIRKENNALLIVIKEAVMELKSKELAAEEYKRYDQQQHTVIFQTLQTLQQESSDHGNDIAELLGYTGLYNKRK